jgi:hypothetical protein
MIQIGALRSRLEKQPTDRRRKPRYLWDRTLARQLVPDQRVSALQGFDPFMVTVLVLQPRHAGQLPLQVEIGRERRSAPPKLAFDERRLRPELPLAWLE